MTEKPIVFLDLEASGLGPASWPVEVGWCFLTGPVRAMLIRPFGDWPESAWDPAAEALHGLSRAELEQSGSSPRDVCAAMNEALSGVQVYSDAPDWDGFWVYRLFDAAKVRRRFEIQNYGALFEGVAPDVYQKAKETAQKKAPHRHRAKDDVLHMRLVYELARKS